MREGVPNEIKLTDTERDGLLMVESVTKDMQGAFTSTAERLRDRGLISRTEPLYQTDGNDEIRWNASMRRGWVLTPDGRRALHRPQGIDTSKFPRGRGPR